MNEEDIHTHILLVDGVVRCIVITCNTAFDWDYAPSTESGGDEIF